MPGRRTFAARCTAPGLVAALAMVVPSAVAGTAFAGQGPGPLGQSAAPGEVPSFPIDTFHTSNGMRVVVSEDPSTAVVAVSVWYAAGSRHEADEAAGISRLVHRAVDRRPGDREAGFADELVVGAGGIHQATAGAEHTAFLEVVPSNRLDLALWIQARRMDPFRLDPAELARWRAVLEEERRLGMEARPWSRASAVLETLAGGGSGRAGPGVPAGPADASPDAVEAFHRRYYVPANALLVVVGAVRTQAVRERVEAYFGALPAGEPAPGPADSAAVRAERPSGPATPEGRRADVVEPGASEAAVWLAYRAPPADHADRHALELLQTILAPGAGSRLGRRLVRTEGVAARLTGTVDLRKGPGMLRLGVLGARGVAADRLAATTQDEIDRILDGGVSPEDLARAVKGRYASMIGRLLTVRGRAEALQWHAFHQGSAHALRDEMARYRAVSPADVARVARTYLAPANRAMVVARPASAEGGGGG